MSEPIDWIQAKRRIEAFLNDEAVLELLTLLEQKYIGEVKSAKKAEDLWRAQARLNAIEEFRVAMLTGIARGEYDEIALQRAEERAKKASLLQL